MKILLVSAFPPPAGGISTWTIMYKKYCDENNIPLSVVNTALKGKRGEQVNNRRNIYDEVKRTLSILTKYKLQISKFQPDIIHLNTSCSRFGILRDYLCIKIACKKRIPIVLHCHCNVNEQVKNQFSIRIMKRMADKVDCVLVLNQNSEKFLRRLTKSKIIKVPNFIDVSMISQKREVSSVINEVLFVGHVQPMKGTVELLKAAKQLQDMHFTLVGPIKEGLDISQHSANVSFLGAKEYHEVKKIYERADVYLFPSHSEGFSLSLTEAMAAGLPCIATDVGANKDMLEDKGGVIIQVGNENAIIQSLKQISDPAIRQKMSDWNIEKVKENYSLEKVMERIISIYWDTLRVKSNI